MKKFPEKIICLTEEYVEFLYDIGREDLIAGVSVYVERPEQAKKLPKIGAFTHANIKKIIEMKPDLIVGFSDIQKDIAKELIAEGQNVFITNQRSLDEIIQTIYWFGSIIGEVEKTEKYLRPFIDQVCELKKIKHENRPKIYIEEWDEPTIIGIKWFTELVELCGGEVLFREKSLSSSKAQDRIIESSELVNANPDIILISWCGKKFDRDSFISRENYSKINAVKNNQIYELSSAIFLQPGPSLFKEGIQILIELISKNKLNFNSLNYFK